MRQDFHVEISYIPSQRMVIVSIAPEAGELYSTENLRNIAHMMAVPLLNPEEWADVINVKTVGGAFTFEHCL